MPTPTRVANKTQWALRDILAATKEAKTAAGEIERILCPRNDARTLKQLLALYKALAEIERKALMARVGDYEE